MHFHLPKPLHGWRAFVGEVGIIVVGVLMALAAEQVVEKMHEKQIAADAREQIRAEIASDIGSLSNRIATESCIHDKLDAIGTFLEAGSAGGVVQAPGWIGRPQIWFMENSRWNAASQAGRAALLPTNEQSEYDDIYGSLQQIGDAETKEQALWAQLRALEGLHHLSDASAFQMRQALSQAKLTDWQVRLAFGQIKSAAEAMQIRPFIDPRYRGSRSMCVPISASRAEAFQTPGVSALEP